MAFSLGEALQGKADLSKKVAIIAEEIERLESIVRNFLEFPVPSRFILRHKTWGM